MDTTTSTGWRRIRVPTAVSCIETTTDVKGSLPTRDLSPLVLLAEDLSPLASTPLNDRS